jgi:hypothetical protein
LTTHAERLKSNESISDVVTVEFWQSIEDMPLDNWIKCTDGDLRHMRKKVQKDSIKTEDDAEAWFIVYDDYIKRYGLSDMYLKLLNTMKKKARLELKYVMTRDPFKETEISVQEAKLRNMLNNNGSSMTIEQSLIHLARFMNGKFINKKEITVEQYFDLLKEYGKHN